MNCKYYSIILIILMSFSVFFPVNMFEVESLSKENFSLNHQSLYSDNVTNPIRQEIVSNSLTNKSTKTWVLPVNFTVNFSIGSENLTDIIGLDIPNINFLQASIHAFLNLTITLEVLGNVSLYHANPLTNFSKFTLGKTVGVCTNFHFELAGGYSVSGAIGEKDFSKYYDFYKDTYWSYQLPTNEWELSLFDIPFIGDLLDKFLNFDFQFEVETSGFDAIFGGYITLEPKIIGKTLFLTETYIEEENYIKDVLQNQKEVKLFDIYYPSLEKANNISIFEELDYVLKSQIVMDFIIGYEFNATIRIENPIFDFYKSIDFGDHFSRRIESCEISLVLLEFEFEPLILNVFHTDDSYISKNLLEVNIIESHFSIPESNLTLNEELNAFLPFPFQDNISLNINAKILFDIDLKHRIQLISPRFANKNETIDLVFVPLNNKAHFKADINISADFSTTSSLLKDRSYSKHNIFSKEIDLPLGIGKNDFRKELSCLIPDIYKLTSLVLDLGEHFTNSQLVIDIVPLIFTSQFLQLKLSSEDIVEPFNTQLLSDGYSRTYFQVLNGIRYNQIKANLTGSGLLQINSSFQPQLSYKANILGKKLEIPLFVGAIPTSTYNWTIFNNQKSGDFLNSIITLPVYFEDKDDTAPNIANFTEYWSIELGQISNKTFIITETQSGVKTVELTSEYIVYSEHFTITTNLLVITVYGISDAYGIMSFSDTIKILLVDNKNNSNEYVINVYFHKENSELSNENDFSQTRDPNWFYTIIGLLILGAFVYFIYGKLK